MQKYKQLEKLKDEQFRRLTGVKRKTFLVMVEILSEADSKNPSLGRKGIDQRQTFPSAWTKEMTGK